MEFNDIFFLKNWTKIAENLYRLNNPYGIVHDFAKGDFQYVSDGVYVSMSDERNSTEKVSNSQTIFDDTIER